MTSGWPDGLFQRSGFFGGPPAVPCFAEGTERSPCQKPSPAVRFRQAVRRRTSDKWWGNKMAQARKFLGEDMRELLAPVAEKGQIDSIEQILRTGPKRSAKLVLVPVITAGVGAIVGAVGYIELLFFGNAELHFSVPLAVVGTLLYLLGIFSFNPLLRLEAQYRLVTALLFGLGKTGRALDTPLVSFERQDPDLRKVTGGTCSELG